MSNKTKHVQLSPRQQPIYQRIYLVTRQIPRGQVATYGQIAAIVGQCTARMVGYAMAGISSYDTDSETPVPWQRVVNAQGKISPRADSLSTDQQRQLLQEESIVFNAQGQIDLRQYRWPGPSLEWRLTHGFDPDPQWREG